VFAQLEFPSVFWQAIEQTVFAQFGVRSHDIQDKTGVCTSNFGSSPDLGFLVIYKVLHKIDREKSYPAGSYPM
jgi:hypothetical protein